MINIQRGQLITVGYYRGKLSETDNPLIAIEMNIEYRNDILFQGGYSRLMGYLRKIIIKV